MTKHLFSPFSWRVKSILLVFFLHGTLLLGGHLLQSSPLLSTDAAPKGLNSIKWAWSAENANLILNSWNEEAKSEARDRLYTDFFFLFFYAAFFSIACAMLSELPSNTAGRIGAIMSWVVWVGALFDVAENLSILRMLDNGATDNLAKMTTVCAWATLLIVGFALYVIIKGSILSASKWLPDPTKASSLVKLLNYGLILSILLFLLPAAYHNVLYVALYTTAAVSLLLVREWLPDLTKAWNLVKLLKYGIIFSILLFLLPVTAFNWMPGYSMLGGIFLEQNLTGVFFTSMALFGAWWSVMFTEGIIVDGLESRIKKDGAITSRTLKSGAYTGHIPEWAEDFFSVPVTFGQFKLFTCMPLLGLLIICCTRISLA